MRRGLAAAANAGIETCAQERFELGVHALTVSVHGRAGDPSFAPCEWSTTTKATLATAQCRCWCSTCGNMPTTCNINRRRATGSRDGRAAASPGAPGDATGEVLADWIVAPRSPARSPADEANGCPRCRRRKARAPRMPDPDARCSGQPASSRGPAPTPTRRDSRLERMAPTLLSDTSGGSRGGGPSLIRPRRSGRIGAMAATHPHGGDPRGWLPSCATAENGRDVAGAPLNEGGNRDE